MRHAICQWLPPILQGESARTARRRREVRAEQLRKIEPEVDSLCANYILEALSNLGISLQVGQRISLRSLAVQSGICRVLAACSKGYSEILARMTRWRQMNGSAPLPQVTAESRWRVLIDAFRRIRPNFLLDDDRISRKFCLAKSIHWSSCSPAVRQPRLNTSISRHLLQRHSIRYLNKDSGSRWKN